MFVQEMSLSEACVEYVCTGTALPADSNPGSSSQNVELQPCPERWHWQKPRLGVLTPFSSRRELITKQLLKKNRCSECRATVPLNVDESSL